MSTFSTASTYISKINEFYPEAGKSNDTQGFRDNFKNTKESLNLLDEDITLLKNKSVFLTNPINDFNNNIIKQAVFQDCGTLVFDTTLETQIGNVVVDYKNGSYQKYKINQGTHSFSIVNLPSSGKSGSIMLYVSTASSSATYVTFSSVNVYNYSSSALPIQISGPNPAIFQIWSDGDPDNLYVQKI